MMNTKEKEFIKLSKLNIGDTPFARSTKFVSRSNFAWYANNSYPKRVKMKVNTNRRKEKLPTSLRVFPIVSRSNSNLFHSLLSLKTLIILIALRAVIALPR